MYEYAELIRGGDKWVLVLNEDDKTKLPIEEPYVIDALTYANKKGWVLAGSIPYSNTITYILKRNKLSLRRLFNL